MGSPVPDEVRAFNAFLAAQQDAEQRDRQVAKAEAAKQQAAANVRAVLGDPSSSRARRDEAEQAYRQAVAEWRSLVEGGTPVAETETETETETEIDAGAGAALVDGDGAIDGDGGAEVVDGEPAAAGSA